MLEMMGTFFVVILVVGLKSYRRRPQERQRFFHAREISRNQTILLFDFILQHDWRIEQCLLHIRVFFGGKTKSPCFDLFSHYRHHVSRSYDNRSNRVKKSQECIYLDPGGYTVVLRNESSFFHIVACCNQYSRHLIISLVKCDRLKQNSIPEHGLISNEYSANP